LLVVARAHARARRPIRGEVQILLARRWVVLGVLGAVVAATAVLALCEPRTYQAKLTLFVEASAPQVLGPRLPDVVRLRPTPRSYGTWRVYLESQRSIITSQAIALRVVDRLGLVDAPELREPGPVRGGRSRDEAAAALRSLLQVAPLVEDGPTGKVLEISVRHRDPAVAVRLCNAVGDGYVEYKLEERVAAARDAAEWLAGQLDQLRRELGDSERALHEFRKQNHVLSLAPGDRHNLHAGRLEKLNERLSETHLARIEAAARRRQIKAARPGEPVRGVPSDRLGGRLIVELNRSYAEEQRVLAALREKYLANHPLVRTQEERVAAAFADLRREIEGAIRATEAQYRELVETERALTGALEAVKQEALELDRKQIAYHRLKQEQWHTERIHAVVLTRLNENRLAAKLYANNVRILDRAREAGLAATNTARNLLVALVVGLLGGMGVAFVLEGLDAKVKSVADVESATGVPTLGVVPAIPDETPHGPPGRDLVDADRDLWIHRHPESRVAERVRAIRTQLLFLGSERPLSTVLVTSPGAGEGKTTTAIELATTLAQAGRRVLLVDADLRRPRVHLAFGVAGEPGLAAVLRGDARLDDAVAPTEVPGLDVLPAGAPPLDPAALLHAPRFGALLGTMVQRYEHVIVDSPPIDGAPDAPLLATHADGVVLVAAIDHTSRQGVRRSVRILDDVGVRMLGCVVHRREGRWPGTGRRWRAWRRRGADEREAGRPAA
jgi:capsular exopolysaccharide synthesis family protein